MVENLRIQDPAIPIETIQTTYVNLLKTMPKKTNLYVKYYTNKLQQFISNLVVQTVKEQNSNMI